MLTNFIYQFFFKRFPSCQSLNDFNRVFSSGKITWINFSVSLTFEVYYITGESGEFIKKCYVMLLYTFLTFLLFSIILLWFSYLYQMSTTDNRILTNHKRELVFSYCQQIFIYHMKLRRHKTTWPGYKGTFSNLNLGSFLSFCMTFFNLS